MMSVGLTVIPTVGVGMALTFAAENCPDLSAFPVRAALGPWLGLAPGTQTVGGRSLPAHSPKVVNRVARVPRMAAMSARKNQTFIGVRHRGCLAQKDSPAAVTARSRASSLA